MLYLAYLLLKKVGGFVLDNILWVSLLLVGIHFAYAPLPEVAAQLWSMIWGVIGDFVMTVIDWVTDHIIDAIKSRLW